MAYDPQKERRRPRPTDDEAAPIEALLDGPVATGQSPRSPADSMVAAVTADATHGGVGPSTSVAEDPPPDVSVTPQPADPWSDRLFFGMSVSTIVGAVVTALVIRWLWMRARRSRSAGEGE